MPLTFIPQQACSIFEPFQLPGEHATLAAFSALLGWSNHIAILPLMPGTRPIHSWVNWGNVKLIVLPKNRPK